MSLLAAVIDVPMAMTEMVLLDLGHSDKKAKRLIETFYERDAKLLVEQHAIHDSEEQLIHSARETADKLELLMRVESRS